MIFLILIFHWAVLQRFQHQQSQLREREAIEKTRSSHFRDSDLYGNYRYREPSYNPASAGVAGRISSNPFHEYLIDRGASAVPSNDNSRVEYNTNDTPRPYHDQSHGDSRPKKNHINDIRSKYTVISNTNMDNVDVPTGKDRDEHGKRRFLFKTFCGFWLVFN